MVVLTFNFPIMQQSETISENRRLYHSSST